MQLITNLSKKLLISALLICSLLITWDEISTDITNIDFMSNSQVGNVPADSIWSSMQHDLNLDHQTQNSQVQAEIRRLLADPAELHRILVASAPYIYYIYKQTEQRGLPAELALIPVIESEFNPYDHSKVGAAGLWQLMSGTAHELGIQVKSNYDGRRNVVASTNAALAYFNDLGHDFKGNWYLAIAAYDCGQGRIQSAVRHQGTDTFWDLRLPKETEHYVPKLLAVAEIVKHPAKYGVTLPPINNKPYFKQVQLDKSMNLAQASKQLDINIKTLSTLNPDYTKKMADKTTNKILVPINKNAPLPTNPPTPANSTTKKA